MVTPRTSKRRGRRFEQVARAAGVGSATVRRHFPTRRAMLEAVSRERVEDLRTRARVLAGTVAVALSYDGSTHDNSCSATPGGGRTPAARRGPRRHRGPAGHSLRADHAGDRPRDGHRTPPRPRRLGAMPPPACHRWTCLHRCLRLLTPVRRRPTSPPVVAGSGADPSGPVCRTDRGACARRSRGPSPRAEPGSGQHQSPYGSTGSGTKRLGAPAHWAKSCAPVSNDPGPTRVTSSSRNGRPDYLRVVKEAGSRGRLTSR